MELFMTLSLPSIFGIFQSAVLICIIILMCIKFFKIQIPSPRLFIPFKPQIFIFLLFLGLLVYPIIKYVNYLQDYSRFKKELKYYDKSGKLTTEYVYNNGSNKHYSYEYEQEGLPPKRTLSSETRFSDFGRRLDYFEYNENGAITDSYSKYLNEFDGYITENGRKEDYYNWGIREDRDFRAKNTGKLDNSITFGTVIFVLLFLTISFYFLYKYKLLIKAKIIFACYGVLLIILFFQFIYKNNQLKNEDNLFYLLDNIKRYEAKYEKKNEIERDETSVLKDGNFISEIRPNADWAYLNLVCIGCSCFEGEECIFEFKNDRGEILKFSWFLSLNSEPGSPEREFMNKYKYDGEKMCYPGLKGIQVRVYFDKNSNNPGKCVSDPEVGLMCTGIQMLKIR